MSSNIFPANTLTNLLVNTLSQSKIVFLPAASTIGAGRALFIKDICGNALRSSIFISTTGLDTLENGFRPSTVYALMSTNYQSVLLAPDGILNWMILQNYNANLVNRFQPNTVPGNVLWLDGTDPAGTGIAPANGSSITTWIDKSGFANHATAGTAPTFNTTGINSKGVLSFNGTNQFLLSQDLYSARSFSIFAIARRQISSTTNRPILGGTDNNTNRNLHFLFSNNTTYSIKFFNNDLNYSSFPTYTGNTATEPAYLLVATFTPGARVLFVNGTQVTQDTTTTFLISAVGIGIGRYSTTFFNGFIGELVVLNGTPATVTRQQLEGYLAWKWGLQASLPATHPFRNAPPL